MERKNDEGGSLLEVNACSQDAVIDDESINQSVNPSIKVKVKRTIAAWIDASCHA
jgi:hypothetical protein